jgi:hypothetical protein
MFLEKHKLISLVTLSGFVGLLVFQSSLHSREQHANSQGKPDYSFIRFWSGTNPKMTVKQLVSNTKSGPMLNFHL